MQCAALMGHAWAIIARPCVESMCHPVVLCWHMQEYEKRLLAKDHEIKVAQANARELRKRLDQANAELADTSRMAALAPAPPQGRPMHDTLY